MTILVTGATGNVGRHVVSGLLDAGADVRALTRHPNRAALPTDVDVVAGDLTVPESLAPALKDVDAVFLLWPSMSAAAAQPAVQTLADDVDRIVYLSAISADSGFWGEVERLVERSGVEWTFLRAGGFATNTLGWAEQIRSDGVVRWPYGAAARSLIHERDIADVAVQALTEDRLVGARPVLTGPAAVTQADQVHLIGEAIGKPLRWEELSPDRAREQLLAEWGDASYVDSALTYWAGLVDIPEPVTQTVREVTGRPARTFRQWAVDHADDFGG